MSQFKNALRHISRRLVYSTPLHRVIGVATQSHDQTYWDKALTGAFQTYLGGTVSIEVRNAVLLGLLRVVHPRALSLLDVGCAAGSLARCPGAEHLYYTGVDISAIAIEEARRLSPGSNFAACKLEEYDPGRSYDVIVFSEVLYYLSIDAALQQFRCYAGCLAPDGLIGISMKHDPKSEAILREISEQYKWVTGILLQEKPLHPEWRIRKIPERPGFLIGFFRVH